MNTSRKPHGPQRWLALLALSLGTVLWLPLVHLLFARPLPTFWQKDGLPPKARELAARHLRIWTDPKSRQGEIERMRRTNAEWDFMGRTFFVWSLAEMSLRNPAEKQSYLSVMDTIIEETLRLEREHGPYFFLMSYAQGQPYVEQPVRSLFLDGEIALMMATRRLVEEKASYRSNLVSRSEMIVERMRRSPVLAAESYPDECWLFDHGVALAALRISDHLDGTDHGAFFRQWTAQAKRHLVHPGTGLLVSSFNTKGDHLDGPEGSSIWMAAHCLRLVDETFARDQYERARKELGRDLLGFAWSREWPASWEGPRDVDSGVVIPVLGVSAGGSGLALVGSASFSDTRYLTRLHGTLDFAAFPRRSHGQLSYSASNQVGDAVVLYACVLGPVWEKVLKP
jgi:hypothetical protein